MATLWKIPCHLQAKTWKAPETMSNNDDRNVNNNTQKNQKTKIIIR